MNPPPQVANPSDAAGVSGSHARFWTHLGALAFLYAGVIVAWGVRNEWPDELLLCLFLLPVQCLVAYGLFYHHRFGLEIAPNEGQQEQLIAALVLAVGVASGQLLLMAVGLSALGIAWLRPSRPGVDWAEWLKLPAIFLIAVPGWLDFAGSRSELARLFEDPTANPVFLFPLEIATSQARFVASGALLALALFVRGREFWIGLPCLPLYLLAITLLPRLFPAWTQLPRFVVNGAPWALAGLLVFLLAAYSHFAARRGRSRPSGETIRHWIEARKYPPWLAVLVIAVMHVLTLSAGRIDIATAVRLVGTAILCGILYRLRQRTPLGPVHSRSVSTIAAALALTLLAEFATEASLRHIALALVIVGLISWHCFWPLRIFAVAISTAIFLHVDLPDWLPIGELLPSFPILCLVIAAGLLMLLAWLADRPLPLAGATGYDEAGWVPPKRFAFILLGLMILFQSASAFWPDQASQDFPESLPNDEPALAPLQSSDPFVQYRISDRSASANLFIKPPARTPYRLQSPERPLIEDGWRIVERRRFELPNGEGVALKIERAGVIATRLWWFEGGGHAFRNHLHARRILWSSWHLTRRQLRVIRLDSLDYSDPADLIAFAERHDWLRTYLHPSPPPAP